MKKSLFPCLALAMSLLSATAMAARFTVGVEETDYFPQYTTKDGVYAGFGRAILDAFAKDRGHAFEYRPLPVNRLFQEFLAGRLDLKYPDNAYWAADQKDGKGVVYSAPVVAYIDGVSVPADRVGKGADAIATLGMVRGFTPWDWLARIEAGRVRVSENNNFTALLNTVLAGRVDGAYANVAVVHHQLAEILKRPGALVFDPALPHTRSHYHLSSIAHPDLVAEFDSWMAQNADRIAALKTRFAVEAGVDR